jgi:predicted nucleic acid-binding protein
LTGIYFDSAYLFKCYVADPDSSAVRGVAGAADVVYSSALCLAEVACAMHRATRERFLLAEQASAARQAFQKHLREGVVSLIPVTESVLYAVQAHVAAMPRSVFLRSGDAVHLGTAAHSGFSEIWSNDKHLLRAAPHFGVKGRSV